jgi:hypothetical protein
MQGIGRLAAVALVVLWFSSRKPKREHDTGANRYSVQTAEQVARAGYRRVVDDSTVVMPVKETRW